MKIILYGLAISGALLFFAGVINSCLENKPPKITTHHMLNGDVCYYTENDNGTSISCTKK